MVRTAGAMFLALLLVAAAKEDPAPPAGPRLLAPESEGEGLAAKYPGDRGLAGAPAVVLAEDFEEDGLADRWDDVRKMPGPVSLTGREDEVHAGSRALRIDWDPAKDTGGHLYRCLPKGEDRLFLRFYVKFPEGHGYVHHFVHLTGYRPSTPWPQGGAGARPAGDERFSTGMDVYGEWGKFPPPGRWGLYSYWCGMKASPDGKFWGNEPPGGEVIRVETGRWTCVEVMLKTNTVGEADGEQAFWVDGKCAGRWTGYRWRTVEDLRVNGVWLLYYVTAEAIRRNKAEPKPQHVLFDDVVAAREYVGPRTESRRPPARAIERPGLPNLRQVDEGVYRGAQPTAEGIAELKKLGVRTVLNLRSMHSDADLLEGSGIAEVRVPMHAWHGEREDIRAAMAVLTDPGKRPVFVHCQHGSDRTGVVCALYRVLAQGWPKEEAIREMTEGGTGFHSLWQNLVRLVREYPVPGDSGK